MKGQGEEGGSVPVTGIPAEPKMIHLAGPVYFRPNLMGPKKAIRQCCRAEDGFTQGDKHKE
jgi:hypothetical protein